MSKSSLLRAAYKVADTCFDSSMKLNATQLNTVMKQITALPRSQALEFVAYFHKALKARIQSRTISVQSAVTLGSDDQNKLEHFLKNIYPHTEFAYEVHDSLLGGLRLQIGDSVLDNSLRRKVEELKV